MRNRPDEEDNGRSFEPRHIRVLRRLRPKRIAIGMNRSSDDDTESSGGEGDETSALEPVEREEDAFVTKMKQLVAQLPLPTTLKVFVNLSRDVN